MLASGESQYVGGGCSDGHESACCPRKLFNLGVELLCWRFNNACAKSGMDPVHTGFRKPSAIVRYREAPAGFSTFVPDQDFTLRTVNRERMLQRVDHEFRDDQTKTDRFAGYRPARVASTLIDSGRRSPTIESARLSHSLDR
jgi:hypothetical protein